MAHHENRLAREASPYLAQHGKNPVDWYPWGDEALARAKAEDKPILLSIGYSACHWCHVMERESFEDEATAAEMNAGFVCIKVDREERPDLDHVYQLTVQLLGRGGGWPLTVFLTPDQRPFFGGTYFPPKPRYGMPSFREVLAAVREAYVERKASVVDQAAEMAKAIASIVSGEKTNGGAVPTNGLARAYAGLAKRFDDEHGGFGSKPKFPSTMSVDLLLRHAVLDRVSEAEARTRRALDGMRHGGIWDHLGGGFHRYSTDEKWLVPHFEKMLYDNALLLRLYLDAGRAFGDGGYVQVARDIAAYLRREMESPQGGFYATTDADSEGEEGRFFVFTKQDVARAIPDDELAREVAIQTFGITDEGNFEETRATVLSLVNGVDRVSLKLGKPPSEIEAALERARAALLAFRETRVRPFRDEKILACWNGLLISALAELGAATGDRDAIESAKRAFSRLERDLIDGGRVRRFTNDRGHRGGPGFLDDHANVALAALDLHEATGEARFLEVARAIERVIAERFEDRDGGGFYFTADDGEALLARTKDAYDQAVPAGAASATLLALRLAARAGSVESARAAAHLANIAEAALGNAFGYGSTIAALDFLARGSVDVVLVGADVSALRHATFSVYAPNRTVVAVDPADVAAAGPLAAGKAPDPSGRAVAYVCHAGTCSLPVTDPEALARLVAEHAHR